MKYMLMSCFDEAAGKFISQEVIEQTKAAYWSYKAALEQAGAFVDFQVMQNSNTATSVRVRDGKTEVLNGPYAETKEQFGSFFVIDVPNLDDAISWAARCPGASFGTVEVRPLWVKDC